MDAHESGGGQCLLFGVVGDSLWSEPGVLYSRLRPLTEQDVQQVVVSSQSSCPSFVAAGGAGISSWDWLICRFPSSFSSSRESPTHGFNALVFPPPPSIALLFHCGPWPLFFSFVALCSYVPQRCFDDNESLTLCLEWSSLASSFGFSPPPRTLGLQVLPRAPKNCIGGSGTVAVVLPVLWHDSAPFLACVFSLRENPFWPMMLPSFPLGFSPSLRRHDRRVFPRAPKSCIGGSGTAAADLLYGYGTVLLEHFVAYAMPLCLYSLLSLVRLLVKPLQVTRTRLGRFCHQPLMNGSLQLPCTLAQVGRPHMPPLVWWHGSQPCSRSFRDVLRQPDESPSNTCHLTWDVFIWFFGGLLGLGVARMPWPFGGCLHCSCWKHQFDRHRNLEAQPDSKLSDAPSSAASQRVFRQPVGQAPLLLPTALPGPGATPQAVPHPARNLQAEFDAQEAQGDRQPDVIPVTVLVFAVDNTPEVVSVALRAPSDVPALLMAVTEARDEARTLLYPQLQEVDPQPMSHYGILLAMPEWCDQEPVVVLDLTHIDGRIFPVVIAWHVNKARLCALASIQDPERVNVYAYGHPQPLAADEWLPARPAGTIFVVPIWEPARLGFQLSVMLMSSYGWALRPALPAPPEGKRFCCVLQEGQRLLSWSHIRPAEYRQVIATAFQLNVEELTVQVTRPLLTDVQLHGYPCLATVAVTTDISLLPVPPGPVVPLLTAFVVDARPLLMGLHLEHAIDGQCSYSSLAEDFSVFQPAGYQVSFEGVRLHGDNMLIDPGQVVIARYVPHRPSTAGLPHDTDDSDSDSSGDEDGGGSPRSDDDMTDAAGGGDTASGTESPARSRTPPRRQHARHAISAGDLLCVPFVRWANEVVRAAVLCEEAETPPDLSLPLHCGQGLAVNISKLPPQRYLQAPILLAERPDSLWPNSIFGNWPLGHHSARGSALCPRAVPGSFGTQDGAAPPHFAATGHPTSSRQLTAASPTGGGRLHAGSDADVTDRLASTTAETNAALYVAMTFLIFAPEYLPEVVQVRASHGQDRHAILAMVAAARSPDPKQRFPRLLPVDQQSSETYGQLIAMPVWDHSGVIVLIDCRLDNRVFAIDVPPRIRLQDILRFADLPDDAAALVYHRDVPWPVPADVWISVCPADLFLVLPADHGFFFTLPFDRLLQDATCWASPPVYPGVFRDQVWVLADTRHFLFTVRRGRRHLVRQDLATSLQCLPARLLLRPAVPTIADHMRNGAFTRAVLVAVQTAPGTTYRSPRLPIVLLDQRPLLLGFSWLSVTDSILDPTALHARYQNRCPVGYVLGYVTQGSRPSPLRDPLVVHDGQVVEIRYLILTSRRRLRTIRPRMELRLLRRRPLIWKQNLGTARQRIRLLLPLPRPVLMQVRVVQTQRTCCRTTHANELQGVPSFRDLLACWHAIHFDIGSLRFLATVE